MNLGAFMNPEYPIFSTTLCYLERDDAYLMLHRVKKVFPPSPPSSRLIPHFSNILSPHTRRTAFSVK